MIQYVLAAAALLSLPVALLAAQSDQGLPRWAANIARKQQVIINGLPRAYAGARDPSPDTRAKIGRGARVFDRHCASCHGWNRRGSGPDAFALVPAPADLEWLQNTPKSRSEPYMYWSVVEGGRQFQSDMPAYKGTLSREEIWAVIAYIRARSPRR